MTINTLSNDRSARAAAQAAARRGCLLLAFFVTATVIGHADAFYWVRQTFTVTNVPEGAKQVRGWFWMPEDRPEQRVIEFRVSEAPGSLRITRDPRYGRRPGGELVWGPRRASAGVGRRAGFRARAAFDRQA